MKKIIFLFICFVPILAFSQVDSSKYALPKKVAKEVVKDIVTGDSAKAILILTEQQLKKTEDIVDLKDGIISTLETKNSNYVQQIEAEKQKTAIFDQQLKLQQKEYKKLKAKNTFNKVFYYLIIGSLGYLYVTK